MLDNLLRAVHRVCVSRLALLPELLDFHNTRAALEHCSVVEVPNQNMFHETLNCRVDCKGFDVNRTTLEVVFAAGVDFFGPADHIYSAGDYGPPYWRFVSIAPKVGFPALQMVS